MKHMNLMKCLLALCYLGVIAACSSENAIVENVKVILLPPIVKVQHLKRILVLNISQTFIVTKRSCSCSWEKTTLLPPNFLT